MKYTTISITRRLDLEIDHVFIHPHNDPTAYENNIAVIEVNSSIPFVDSINAAVLPKSSPIPVYGKLNLTVPHYADDTFSQSLKSYMASFLPTDDCAAINGNSNFSTNTLMCIDGMFSPHDVPVSLKKSLKYFIKQLYRKKNHGCDST